MAEAQLLAHQALIEYRSGAKFRAQLTWAAAMAALEKAHKGANT